MHEVITIFDQRESCCSGHITGIGNNSDTFDIGTIADLVRDQGVGGQFLSPTILSWQLQSLRDDHLVLTQML